MMRGTKPRLIPRRKNDMANIKPPPKKSEAYENFESLAKQLLKVPKKELDKRMDEYERQKEQHPRKRKPMQR